MKNGAQKDLKIHEQLFLGRPRVDFLGPWADFGEGRKIVDLWIAFGAAKKPEKSSQGAAKGRQGDFEDSARGPRRRQGLQGGLARS